MKNKKCLLLLLQKKPKPYNIKQEYPLANDVYWVVPKDKIIKSEAIMLLDDLREQIETFRFHFYELVDIYGRTDPIVLAKSSELDELLNQYQKHYAEKKNKNIAKKLKNLTDK
ncbi:hypothetical protein AMS62_26490 [Bacillus sp. FJAT-18019]|nr:hypothetical protein AMS62_26490 [Bacillus sp. FJAT-18019]